MLDWLKTILGDAYTEDIAQKISDEIGKGFIAREDFNTLNEAKKQLDIQIKERDKKISELQGSTGDNTELQSTIQALQSKLEEGEKAHASQITQMQREAVDGELLVAARAKNANMVRGLLGEIDEKIDIEEYRKQREKEIEGLAKAKESSFAFDTGPQMKGAKLGQGKDPGQSESTDESAQVAARIAKSVGETATGQSNYFN